MSRDVKQTPPPRKEPGLLSKTLTTIVRLISGLIAALLLSIVIEWIGMGFFWPEQGEDHARRMLQTESRYLDQRFSQSTLAIGRSVYQLAQHVNRWMVEKSGIVPLMQWISTPATETKSTPPATIAIDLKQIFQCCQSYVLAAFYIIQLFFMRLAIIVLSLSVFLLFATVGLIDGLVERGLRRYGGGRESSNVYNLARKSVLPAFMAACVVYISLPLSVHPAVILLPFAILLGFSVKMTFSKLKKYF